MKVFCLLPIAGLMFLATSFAALPGHAADFSGTYIATLPERAEILQLHRDGTAEITLSDQSPRAPEGSPSATASARGRSPVRAGSPRAS